MGHPCHAALLDTPIMLCGVRPLCFVGYLNHAVWGTSVMLCGVRPLCCVGYPCHAAWGTPVMLLCGVPLSSCVGYPCHAAWGVLVMLHGVPSGAAWAPLSCCRDDPLMHCLDYSELLHEAPLSCYMSTPVKACTASTSPCLTSSHLVAYDSIIMPCEIC